MGGLGQVPERMTSILVECRYSRTNAWMTRNGCDSD